MVVTNEDLLRRRKEVCEIEKYFSICKVFEKSLTQAKLCSEMGISAATYSQWLSCARRIPDKRFIYLGKRLGFDVLKLRPDLMQGYFLQINVEVISRLSLLTPEQRTRAINFIDSMIEENSKT